MILDFLDEVMTGTHVRRQDPSEHAIEQMLIAKEGPLTDAGYRFVMNQDRAARQSHLDAILKVYSEIDDFLNEHSNDGIFLFPEFGLTEAVFTPLFMRFWFLDYYEGFELPTDGRFDRVRRWRDACLVHPAAQQVSREKIVKLFYDYALGAGNGALLPKREKSSFLFQPTGKIVHGHLQKSTVAQQAIRFWGCPDHT